MHTEKVVVAGAGPAGLAACGQLRLYGIDPLVVESDEPGGLLLNAWSVVNYPGAPRGISGKELAGRFPVPENIHKDTVTKVARDPSGSYLIDTETSQITARAVIVATGTIPVTIPLPGVPRNRVYHDVKHISEGIYRSAVIIGGGDAALDYAMTLSGFMAVRVLSRGGFDRCAPHLLKSAGSTRRITLAIGSFREADLPHDGCVVVACGRTPNVAFVSGNLLCSPPEDGSFHLCGDCVNGSFRQASIAAGNGVMAAMRTVHFLEKEAAFQ
jgi:thioredoxin reductase